MHNVLSQVKLLEVFGPKFQHLITIFSSTFTTKALHVSHCSFLYPHVFISVASVSNILYYKIYLEKCGFYTQFYAETFNSFTICCCVVLYLDIAQHCFCTVSSKFPVTLVRSITCLQLHSQLNKQTI